MTASFLAHDVVPVAHPTVGARVIFTGGIADADNRVHASLAAAYLQDQIRPARWLEILAGLRLERLKIALDDLHVGGSRFARIDEMLSPHLALVLKPSNALSLYTSYSRSHLPQSGDQFGSLTPVTETLKPERFDNYEIGGKLQLAGGLLASAAIYRLERTNTRAADPANPARTLLTGAQRSRGFELGLEWSITRRWLMSAGYALQKAEITKATAAAPAGRGLPLVPRSSFSLWNRYQFSKKLGIGFGVIARTSSYASISNAVKLPGYSRVDVAFYYKLLFGIDAQLNVDNLLDAHYFPAANADNNIIPGAPRTVKAVLGYRF